MLYRALVTIMNNEKKIQEVKKEAGGDEKLIFKFAWPNENHFSSNIYSIRDSQLYN